MTAMTALLELRGVSRHFARPARPGAWLGRLVAGGADTPVRAVDLVDLQVRPGEVMGLVGESGCGKSTLGRLVAGLLPPTTGSVLYGGNDLARMSPAQRRSWRPRVQMVFQDPSAALNPRMRVGAAISQGAVLQGLVPRGGARDLAAQLLERVGLPAAAAGLYPHQFSGGQRQRINIARALALRPEFLVCDEPVAALDVSVQAQVLNLFTDLRAQLRLTYLFISHDLGVVEQLCDRVAVMYLGRLVETGPAEAIFSRPLHPYTAALLAEAPRIGAPKPVNPPIRGEIPSPMAPPPGCHFHPRCPAALPRCRSFAPVLRQVGTGQAVACHLHDPAGAPAAGAPDGGAPDAAASPGLG